jgi:hypothetical protein
MAIRRKSLQSLEQHREGHDGSPDRERPRPSEAEHESEREIANDVVDLPTESRAGYQFRGTKGGKYEQQDQDGRAADLYDRFGRHFVVSMQRETIVRISGRRAILITFERPGCNPKATRAYKE